MAQASRLWFHRRDAGATETLEPRQPAAWCVTLHYALAAATVGVAMGAAGTDVALETADVALMADDLGKLVYALGLARRNDRIVRQNLLLSALVIGGLVLGAVTGTFSLPVAVIGHELSEFAVIANGLRMLRA